MKIALVHDWLTNMGGAEQCVLNFKEVFKDAPIYTSLYTPKNMDDRFKLFKIQTSFIQKLPFKSKHQHFFPLMPLAFERFDFNSYDVVLSSTSCCAKGIVTNANCTHICYCFTPIRYVWERSQEYTQGMHKWTRFFVSILLHYVRLWDFCAANRVDYFIAISTAVQARIKKYYGRDSAIIFPPVRCSLFNISDVDGDYYFIVSRLVGYKRFDIAVQACSALNKKLVVIGDGPELKNLKKLAGPTVIFMGRQPDSEVKKHMAECKALLFPGEEDFGIVPVEAQGCGRPVIAYGKGGALDTVLDGKTGMLFKEQSIDSLCEAIQKFETMSFDKSVIREWGLQFDESIFRRKIKEFVESKV